jgi:hypothetical protein
MIKTPIDISLDPFNDENTDYLDDECADYFLDHDSECEEQRRNLLEEEYNKRKQETHIEIEENLKKVLDKRNQQILRQRQSEHISGNE